MTVRFYGRADSVYSDTYSQLTRLRRGLHRSLLAAAAFAGLSFGLSQPAFADPDDCTLAGATATCTDDRSQGIASGDDFPSSFTTLNVFGLDGDIMPAAGVNGIYFQGNTSVTIDSNLGNDDIRITGTAAGIFARGLTGGVTINHQGDIYNAELGIYADALGGDAVLDIEADIVNSNGSAIDISADGAGAAYLTYEGDIRNSQATGINIVARDEIDIDHDGDIEADSHGIYARSSNPLISGTASGPITIDSDGEIEATNGSGIIAEAEYAGGSVTIMRDGDIEAGDHGIFALGHGNVSVTSDGDITAWGINGVHAYSLNGTAAIVSDGEIRADNQGLFAHGSTGASIDSDGDVTTGIGATNGNDALFALTSTGDATVMSKGDIFTGAGRGIVAMTNDGDATVTGSGDIDAAVSGITADTDSGDATVNYSGDIVAAESWAIQAITQNGNATVTLKGDASGDPAGLQALVDGGTGGNATVTVDGDVYSEGGPGIEATVTGTTNGGNATINSKGDVDAKVHGLLAIVANGGGATGNASITHRGDINSREDTGAHAYSQNGNASIDVRGDTTAQNMGLHAVSNSTTGSASVTNRGDIDTEENDGIHAYTSGSGAATVNSVGDIFTAGTTDGVDGGRGIFARSAGGSAMITSQGDVTASGHDGIVAQGVGGSASVVSTGDVWALEQGIFAQAGGPGGDASIDSDGDVFADNNDGLFAYSAGSGTANAEVTSVGDVDGGVRGIRAQRDGDGNAIVNSTGAVTSVNDGVSAVVNGNGDATINQSGNVTSTAVRGIIAEAQGNGNAEVTSDGVVMAAFEGVTAFVSGNGDATVTHDGNVTSTGGGVAVQAVVLGNGDAMVDVAGDVTSDTGRGVQALVQGAGNATIVSNGSVNAYNEAILGQAADGDVSITQTGDVTSQMDRAIYAEAFGAGHSASVMADGDMQASSAGIVVLANGNATINSSGDVTSTNDRGLDAESFGAGGSAQITSVGDIQADSTGAFAQSNGNATIASTGDVTSTTERGLYARSGAVASVTSTGNVNADDEGIFAQGVTGATIVSTGNVTSTNSDAILALNSGAGVASVTGSGAVDGGDRGIVAINNSPGDSIIEWEGNVVSDLDTLLAVTSDGSASITSNGNVTSNNQTAIRAMSADNGNATVNSTGVVTANHHGIQAIADDGSASVTQTGNVNAGQSGNNGVGIQAQAGNGNATVNSSGAVSAYHEGILAIAAGGNVDVDHVGNITSLETYGVNALVQSDGFSADVNIDGDVTGELHAIHVVAVGPTSGGPIFPINNSIMVTANGNLTAIQLSGIFAQADGSGGTVAVDADGDIESRMDGIFALADMLVDVDHVGDITSSNARGIFAQSNNGNVWVDVDGRIEATGAFGDADGIFANTPNGSANVMVSAASRITGGSEPDASFAVEFGASTGTNTLTNYGILDDANAGKTVGGDTGDDIVLNYGMVDGDFFLGTGANRFDNMLGGTTYFKDFSSVGAGNDFNNWGTVSPFGQMMVGSSILEGNYNQFESGVFVADVDLDGSTADFLDVTEDVEADGLVRVFFTSLNPSLSYSGTIISSNQTVTDNGIAGEDRPQVDVDVTTTATTVDISVQADLGGFGQLSGNQEELGEFFQDLFDASSGSLTPDQEAFYLALLNSLEYEDTLDSLSPESANAAIAAAFASAESFAGNLFSCKQREGAYRYVAEGTCAWAAAGGRFASHDGGSGGFDSDDAAFTISGGAQFATDQTWSFGFGLGYEHGETDVDPSTDLERDLFNLGLVAKGTFGNTTVGVALSGGIGEVDSERHLTIPVPATAKADRSIHYGALTGRVAHLFDMGGFYLKPMVEGAATFVSADGYTESGAGVANLSVDDQDDFVGRGSVSLEFGGEFGATDGILIRPFVAAGISVLSDADIDVDASFPGLGAGTVTLTTEMDSLYVDARAGVDILSVGGWVGRLEYNGRFSSDDQQHSGMAKLSVPF